MSQQEAQKGHTSLAIDYAAEAKRIEEFLVRTTVRELNRRGVVVGVSGGIDSAVCVTLAARAFGTDRVLAILMPEKEGSDDAMGRAERLCRKIGVSFLVEPIGQSLEAIGCYRRRDAAIRKVLPAYGAGWRHKIVTQRALEGRLPVFHLVVESPQGVRSELRMPHELYLEVVAATNFKQRIRKMIECYHAERLNYAVMGTPNRLEYELGFFVRGGDGLADIKPIAHLYKTQVYEMAAHIGVTEEIRAQTPSTDTYSLPQTQEEFYYALPYPQADVLLDAMNRGVSDAGVAPSLGLDEATVARLRNDFQSKRRAAYRLARDAVSIHGPVAEKGGGVSL